MEEDVLRVLLAVIAFSGFVILYLVIPAIQTILVYRGLTRLRQRLAKKKGSSFHLSPSDTYSGLRWIFLVAGVIGGLYAWNAWSTALDLHSVIDYLGKMLSWGLGGTLALGLFDALSLLFEK